MATRREFLNAVTAAAAGLAVSTSAKSYTQILGSNDRLNFAVIGLNSRGYAHLSSLKANRSEARILRICDVDGKILQKFSEATREQTGEAPVAVKDFREVLELKEIDAVSIATPDHWHTPMAIRALQAGKHVYLEKPCSHDAAEGALLIEAQQKYGKLVQIGTQQRSSPHTIEVIQKMRDGVIGRPYFAKSWYVNTRTSIGIGKEAPVPPQLDWDLWQGPAPRRSYKDNVHPYNWHFFRNWGTGEALNNGTHEVDVCRWALAVDYPRRVTASGGRYQFNDDYQFYDTLVTSFEYDGCLISWESKSCNGMREYGRERGAAISGTNGTVIVDRDGYEIYDLKGKKTAERKAGTETHSADLVGADSMTDAHFANFIAGIRTGAKLNAPVAESNISSTSLHLSNIAWEVNRELHLDTKDGTIQNDPEAMKLWGRDYEKGWAPRV